MCSCMVAGDNAARALELQELNVNIRQYLCDLLAVDVNMFPVFPLPPTKASSQTAILPLKFTVSISSL